MGSEHPNIARRLVEARRALGFSQRELGNRSGLTQAQISRIENGLVDMRVSTLLALAGELQLRLSFKQETRLQDPTEKPSPPKARRKAIGDKSTQLIPSVASRTGIFGDIDEELL